MERPGYISRVQGSPVYKVSSRAARAVIQRTLSQKSGKGKHGKFIRKKMVIINDKPCHKKQKRKYGIMRKFVATTSVRFVL